ncbi:MAG: DUF308 domain-containing protein [Eggerthellaceae bacterium]|nr:DUF308 domain-containing protein [Eggerthellaceae bacterium]
MASTLKKVFRSYVVDGLLLVALGVAILIWPDTSLKVLCIAIGVALCVMAAVKGAMFALGSEAGRRVLDLLIAIVDLALGIALIVQSDFFISLFQIVVGVILLYGSVLLFIQAIQLREIRGFFFVAAIVFGVLTAALGVVILMNPAAFASFIMQLQGVAIIFLGVGLIVVMQRIKADVEAINGSAQSLVSLRARQRAHDDDVIDVEAVEDDEDDGEYDADGEGDAEEYVPAVTFGRMTSYRSRR